MGFPGRRLNRQVNQESKPIDFSTKTTKKDTYVSWAKFVLACPTARAWRPPHFSSARACIELERAHVMSTCTTRRCRRSAARRPAHCTKTGSVKVTSSFPLVQKVWMFTLRNQHKLPPSQLLLEVWVPAETEKPGWAHTDR